jgi:integrase/recombinase XerD
MQSEIVKATKGSVSIGNGGPLLPAIIAQAGDHAARRFIEFFTVTIRNGNTRRAYAKAVGDFLAWCEGHGLTLPGIEPLHVASYIEQLTQAKAAPTVKQHLAAISMLFDWLTSGGIIDFNPAASVRGPKYSVKRGKTPVLTAEEARHLLDSIAVYEINEETKLPDPDRPILIGLRDRALIAVMVYSFARVSAALAMKVEDYFTEGRRAWFRLHEKGGKRHEVPAHHNAESYLDAYIKAAGIATDKKGPLFRSIDRYRKMTSRPLTSRNALDMIKGRAKALGLPETICCHTFRATGITVFRLNGGTVEEAQHIANHASPKTTMLYDRSRDQITLDEVERVVI